MTVVVVADRHKLTGQSGEATGTTQAELDGGCGVPVNLLRIGQPDQEGEEDIKNRISNHGSIYWELSPLCIKKEVLRSAIFAQAPQRAIFYDGRTDRPDGRKNNLSDHFVRNYSLELVVNISIISKERILHRWVCRIPLMTKLNID